jgi:hypothetical protein
MLARLRDYSQKSRHDEQQGDDEAKGSQIFDPLASDGEILTQLLGYITTGRGIGEPSISAFHHGIPGLSCGPPTVDCGRPDVDVGVPTVDVGVPLVPP